ncbi:MAG: hypothetical protein U0746_03445 [Gemmataceae bacterium]
MARFYSVQSAADVARLAAGGEPWPTGLQRANLGSGFYAWDAADVADTYLRRLETRGVTGLVVTGWEVDDDALMAFKTLDLTRLPDEDVDAWLATYSHYGDARPHDFEVVVRLTNVGTEYFFAPPAFRLLRMLP